MFQKFTNIILLNEGRGSFISRSKKQGRNHDWLEKKKYSHFLNFGLGQPKKALQEKKKLDKTLRGKIQEKNVNIKSNIYLVQKVCVL